MTRFLLSFEINDVTYYWGKHRQNLIAIGDSDAVWTRELSDATIYPNAEIVVDLIMSREFGALQRSDHTETILAEAFRLAQGRDEIDFHVSEMIIMPETTRRVMLPADQAALRKAALAKIAKAGLTDAERRALNLANA